MRERRIKGVRLLFFENLSRIQGIFHFISTREGGVSQPPYEFLNLNFAGGDDPKKVEKNWRILSSALGIPLSYVVLTRQKHGDKVVVIKSPKSGKFPHTIGEGDAMVTSLRHHLLVVLVADCVPLLLIDIQKKVIGIVHAGWRGTLQNVTGKTVEVFRKEFKSNPKDIYAGIGPSIGPCCYQVGEDIVEKFRKAYPSFNKVMWREKNKKFFLNLWEINKHQLKSSGIPEENIEVSRICTFCNHWIFFSQRWQKGPTGRFAGGIMLKDENL